MPSNPLGQLGRRERQIMDVVFRLGRATASEVRSELADPPSYSAVRGMLRLLEEKGHLRHEQDGPRYVYRPTADPAKVSRGALRHVVRTFFDNSAASAVAAMLGGEAGRLTDEELERLERLIEDARRERKGGDR